MRQATATGHKVSGRANHDRKTDNRLSDDARDNNNSDDQAYHYRQATNTYDRYTRFYAHSRLAIVSLVLSPVCDSIVDLAKIGSSLLATLKINNLDVSTNSLESPLALTKVPTTVSLAFKKVRHQSSKPTDRLPFLFCDP